MYLLDCGPQRDGVGELLPSLALFAEAPDRRLVKGGGMREFTTRFSTARASVRMQFKEMAPFFFRVLEPSAPTTLTSWGRLPVWTPTTVASHDSRTPVSGGRAIGLWCRWSWEGTFATPVLDILGATSSGTPTTERCGAASNAIDGRGEAPSPLPSLSSWGRHPVRTTTTEQYGAVS